MMIGKIGMGYAGNNSAFVCSLDAKSFGNWGTPRKKNGPKENKKEIGFKLGGKIFW
jgi:hypothetical protein